MAIKTAEIKESPWNQRVNEGANYSLDTTPYGGTPASVVLLVMDYGSDVDVTSLVVVGIPTVSGNLIQFTLKSTVARKVVLTVQFVTGLRNPARPFAHIEFYDVPV